MGNWNRRANQLAHYLRALGVGPEQRVGLCLGRSPDLVIALLAILKAGAAYVPLDPDYPAQRLRFIAQDASIRIVVTEKAFARATPSELLESAVRLDADSPRIAGKNDGNPCITLSAANMAYVIYTSGSTGTPKGVVVNHHNIVRLLDSTREQFAFFCARQMAQPVPFHRVRLFCVETLGGAGLWWLRCNRTVARQPQRGGVCGLFEEAPNHRAESDSGGILGLIHQEEETLRPQNPCPKHCPMDC